MGIDIRLPNITATNADGQLTQIRSYLYQFAEQLQWALNTLEAGGSSNSIVLKNASGNDSGDDVEKSDEVKAHETFNRIKDLIIKSADIITAYTEKIEESLSGKYVAQSDFGTYTEEANAQFLATPKYVEGKFILTETIDGELVEKEFDLDGLAEMVRKQEGIIRYGNVKTTLTPDENTIGIELGEFDEFNGIESKRFATFSAAGIELYGSNQEVPVATITKDKITITNAEFDGYVTLGNYKLDLTSGIAFKWIGG